MITLLTSLLENARQLPFPAEFRIGEISSPVPPVEAVEQPVPAPVKPAAPEAARGEDEPDQLKFYGALATGVWRLRQRMLAPGTTRPKEEFRREYREVESLWDLLAAAGVEIKDHTGQPFDPGLAIKVMAYQPSPGVARDRVQETIKPSVFLHGRHIQMGEIIVETPERPAPPPVRPD